MVFHYFFFFFSHMTFTFTFVSPVQTTPAQGPEVRPDGDRYSGVLVWGICAKSLRMCFCARICSCAGSRDITSKGDKQTKEWGSAERLVDAACSMQLGLPEPDRGCPAARPVFSAACSAVLAKAC